jgi:hypothetical protein
MLENRPERKAQDAAELAQWLRKVADDLESCLNQDPLVMMEVAFGALAASRVALNLRTLLTLVVEGAVDQEVMKRWDTQLASHILFLQNARRTLRLELRR